MKTKKLLKKLSLKKVTVTNLNEQQMTRAVGGIFTQDYSCTCPDGDCTGYTKCHQHTCDWTCRVSCSCLPHCWN